VEGLAAARLDLGGGVDRQLRVDAQVAAVALERRLLAPPEELRVLGVVRAVDRRLQPRLVRKVLVHELQELEQLAGGAAVLGDDLPAAVLVLGQPAQQGRGAPRRDPRRRDFRMMVDVALHRQLAAVLVAHLVGDLRRRQAHLGQLRPEPVAEFIEVEVDGDLPGSGPPCFSDFFERRSSGSFGPERGADPCDQ
jgi:hypothetical protein